MEKGFKKQSTLDKISEGFFRLLGKSFIGKFFTSYEKSNAKILKKTTKKAKKTTTSPRKKMVKAIEKSKIFTAIQTAFSYLLRISVRDYGIMLLIMSGVIAGLYPLTANGLILFLDVSFSKFIFGLAIAVCSVPLLFSSRSLASSIIMSKPMCFILFTLMGYDEDRLREIGEQNRVTITNIAVLFGLLLAVGAYFASPINILVVALIVAFIYSVFRIPEIGAISIIFMLPFADQVAISVVIACTFLSFVIKLFMGKRLFKLELIDIFAFASILLMTFLGLNYANITTSLGVISGNLVLLMCYFVISNTIRSKLWFRKALVSLVTSALVVSVIAIIQTILGKIGESAPQLLIAFPYTGNVASVFNSPEILAQFLVVALPFTLLHLFSERNSLNKFLGFIMTSFLVVALFMTGSTSAIIGAIVSLLFLLIVFNRNYIYLALVLLITLPILYFSLPDTASSAVLGWMGLSEESISSVFVTMKDDFLMVIKEPFGFKAGSYVSDVYEGYPNEYIESLPIQLIFEYGIIVLFALIVFLVVFSRMIFSYCANAKNKYRRINLCAGYGSLVGIFTMGFFSHVWLDFRIFLVCILAVALSCAYIKIEREDTFVEPNKGSFNNASIDLELTGDERHNEVSRRRYVHAPKKKAKEKISKAKEFENTAELIRIIQDAEEK